MADGDLTKQDMIDRLRAAIRAAGGQREFADGVGMTQGMVSMVLNGSRNPSAPILSRLGLEAVTVYRVARR